LELIDLAFAVRREYEAGRMDGNQMVDEALALGCALEELAAGRFTYEPNRRLAKHLAKHPIHWFWFLIEPGIDATNYRAEQAIRPPLRQRLEAEAAVQRVRQTPGQHVAAVPVEQLPPPSFHDERRYGFGLAIGLAPVVV
jgi:hypothetical protein